MNPSNNFLISKKIEPTHFIWIHCIWIPFIRSYYLCGMGEIFSLKDNRYDEFIRNVYYWNKGDKSKLKKLYGDMLSEFCRIAD